MNGAAEKPPIGIEPYYIATMDRVQSLAEAISRYAMRGSTHTRAIKLWAREIIKQCEITEELTEEAEV